MTKKHLRLSLATCLIAAAPLMLAGATSALPAATPESRLVLAFYYAWFDPGSFGPGKTSDQPVTPYRSSDRPTIERQVGQAKHAGIDALVQSWYGPRDAPDNQTESNFCTLLDVCREAGMRAAVDFEVGSPFITEKADVQAALATLLAGHAKHPAYLRVDGKPVIFFWYNSRFTVAEWAAIRAAVDPNHSSIWIGEGTDVEYLRVFDGHHLYNVAWSEDPQATLNTWGGRVRSKAAELGQSRYWVATAMPGWNDLALGRASSFVRGRDGGGYYRASFAGAASSRADWVIITSFSEWPEGTMIEPSVTYGNTYLNLTRELAAAFRAYAAAPLVQPSPIVALAAALTVTPLPSATATTAPTATRTAPPTATRTATPPPTRTPSATPSATPSYTPSVMPWLTPTQRPEETGVAATELGPGSPTGAPEIWEAGAALPLAPAGAVAILFSAVLAGAWRSIRGG